MATTFGWKRKCPQNLARKRAALFDESNQIPNEDESEPFEEDWRVLLVKRGVLGIEDSVLKRKRLQDEGVALAEQQRYMYWNDLNSILHVWFHWIYCQFIVTSSNFKRKATASMCIKSPPGGGDGVLVEKRGDIYQRLALNLLVIMILKIVITLLRGEAYVS